MTKENFLELLGFPTDEWSFLTNEEVQPLLRVEVREGQMAPLNYPAIEANFGAGCYAAKKDFIEKHMPKEKQEEVSVFEAPKDGPIPVAPPVPPAPTSEEKVVQNEQTEQVSEEEEIPKLAKIRAANLISKGWVEDNGSICNEELGLFYSYKDLAELDNSTYMSYIRVKPKETPKPKEEPKKEAFTCKGNVAGQPCEKQCKLCKQADENGNTPDQQAELNQKAVDEAKAKEEAVTKQNEEDAKHQKIITRLQVVENLGMSWDEKHKAYSGRAENKKYYGISKDKIYEASDDVFEAAVNGVTKFIEDNKVVIPDEIENEKKREAEAQRIDTETHKEEQEALEKAKEIEVVDALEIHAKSELTSASKNRDTEEVLKKAAPPVKKSEKLKEVIENIPKGTNEVADEFAIADQLIGMMMKFKNQTFLIHKMKDIVSYDDKDEDVKLQELEEILNQF